MNDSTAKTTPVDQRLARRPSRATCERCGQPVSLVDCGVREHRQTRTLRERLDDRCPGRVYAHDATGGIECREVAPESESELRAAWGDR